jgi:molecular chaperone DnaJ
VAPQREWFEKDYYKVLGVSDTATEKDITRAYRKLAKQHHPDAGGGDEAKFKEISAAYDVLGDPAKRKEYDEVRRLGPVGAGGFRPFEEGGFGGSFRIDDLGDLFGGLFNRGRNRAGGTAGTRATGPQRGQDLEAHLHLSFLDAVNGLTTTVNVTSDAVCSACHGTGAAPGTSPVICPTCGGRGVVDENQGFFSFSQPCRTCGGSGMKVETPCRNCAGTGTEHRPRQIKVRVPAGVENGQRIRVKGRGGAGQNGGPSGDLYVVVSVAPHELFGRNGKDLTVTVPITFAEAALGATVKVPTLDAPVSVKIPAGTRSGRTFRVRGHGVPAASGAGDLLVTVEVTVPAQLTDEQRAVLEQVQAAFPESPRGHLGV